MSSPQDGRGTHSSDIEIAAYVDHRLSGDARDRVEHHLAECAECRHVATRSREVLHRRHRPRQLLIGAGTLAAAAAVFLLVVQPARQSRDAETGPTLRGPGSDAALPAYHPIGDVAREPVSFVWGSVNNAASYRLTVSHADGTALWTASSADTTTVLPDSVSLQTGQRHVWIVDALLMDGTVRSTGFKEFGFKP